ncbi:hypothetical protein A5686_20395 [Mycobacterium sp. E2479]|nr:hypothetical protein A5686_20395 [Mycobacterium sp. E2479]
MCGLRFIDPIGLLGVHRALALGPIVRLDPPQESALDAVKTESKPQVLNGMNCNEMYRTCS